MTVKQIRAKAQQIVDQCDWILENGGTRAGYQKKYSKNAAGSYADGIWRADRNELDRLICKLNSEENIPLGKSAIVKKVQKMGLLSWTSS